MPWNGIHGLKLALEHCAMYAGRNQVKIAAEDGRHDMFCGCIRRQGDRGFQPASHKPNAQYRLPINPGSSIQCSSSVAKLDGKESWEATQMPTSASHVAESSKHIVPEQVHHLSATKEVVAAKESACKLQETEEMQGGLSIKPSGGAARQEHT